MPDQFFQPTSRHRGAIGQIRTDITLDTELEKLYRASFIGHLKIQTDVTLDAEFKSPKPIQTDTVINFI